MHKNKYSVSKIYTSTIKFSKRATAVQRKKAEKVYLSPLSPQQKLGCIPLDRRVKHKDMNDSTSGSSTSLDMYLLYQRELQRQVRSPFLTVFRLRIQAVLCHFCMLEGQNGHEVYLSEDESTQRHCKVTSVKLHTAPYLCTL